MTERWLELAWAESALDRALIALSRASGLAPSDAELPPMPRDPNRIGEWLTLAAEHTGLNADAVDCQYEELSQVLSRVAPALVRVTDGAEHRYLAVVRSGPRALQVITPSGANARVATRALRVSLSASIEALPQKRVSYLLETAGIRGKGARKARDRLLGLYLSEERIGGMWLLRPDPGAPFVQQLRRSGVLNRVALVVLLSIAQVAITLWGWVLIGRGALTGALELGWLLAWLLACLSAVPLQAAALQLGGRLLDATAALLKQRLLCGALRLDADSIRSRGSGRLFAMVSESEAIETTGLGAAFALALSLVQLASAVVILAFGAGGPLLVASLAACCASTAWLVVRSWRLRSQWTEQRFDLAKALVEHVVGHRTRIAQQPSLHWHRSDDRQLERYVTASRSLDAAQLQLHVLPARSWLIVSSAALIAVGWASPAEPLELAIAIGGMLQAYAAFGAFGAQCTAVGNALIAWQRVGELFRAAARTPALGHPAVALRQPLTDEVDRTCPTPLLELRAVTFTYRSSGEPVLRDCSLTVASGDRLLLEGPSGGGKSTLAALISGLRLPTGGQLLLRGLDRPTLGARAWREQIASAPQFHENHILSGSLAFNLLLGRSWPASDADRAEAEAVCRELGLGPMIDRMPSKLNQIIGESGWQLSHGERSRLFLARALLQHADLVILDESFGALDPITLEQCMQTVLRRAPALLVIAHP